MPYNDYLVERVRRSLNESHTSFEEKKMFGGLHFMVDDKLCTGVFKEELLVRINPENEEEYLQNELFFRRIKKGYRHTWDPSFNLGSHLSTLVNQVLFCNKQ